MNKSTINQSIIHASQLVDQLKSLGLKMIKPVQNYNFRVPLSRNWTLSISTLSKSYNTIETALMYKGLLAYSEQMGYSSVVIYPYDPDIIYKQIQNLRSKISGVLPD